MHVQKTRFEVNILGVRTVITELGREIWLVEYFGQLSKVLGIAVEEPSRGKKAAPSERPAGGAKAERESPAAVKEALAKAKDHTSHRSPASTPRSSMPTSSPLPLAAAEARQAQKRVDRKGSVRPA